MINSGNIDLTENRDFISFNFDIKHIPKFNELYTSIKIDIFPKEYRYLWCGLEHFEQIEWLLVEQEFNPKIPWKRDYFVAPGQQKEDPLINLIFKRKDIISDKSILFM